MTETGRYQQLWNNSPRFRADNPDFWLRRNAADPMTARIADLPHKRWVAVNNFLRALETVARTDEIQAVIESVLGDRARGLKLRALPRRGPHRGTLFIECPSHCAAFALRAELPALKAALKPYQINDVRFG